MIPLALLILSEIAALLVGVGLGYLYATIKEDIEHRKTREVKK